MRRGRPTCRQSGNPSCHAGAAASANSHWPVPEALQQPARSHAQLCSQTTACRLFVIARCPKLKVLDFKKVKQAEREEANKLYGGDAAPATFEPDEDLAEVRMERGTVLPEASHM